MIAQHSSESNEHYTPADIVERARHLMGGIDYDPASCSEANKTIKAETYLTYKEDGLRHWDSWHGNVFLNPPGGKLHLVNDHWIPISGGPGQSSMAVWWNQLAMNYADGNIDQAFFVAFNLEILRTSQYLIPVQRFYRCYPRERIRFSGQKSPTHANLLIWLPPKEYKLRNGYDALAIFKNVFEEIGLCEGPANS